MGNESRVGNEIMCQVIGEKTSQNMYSFSSSIKLQFLSHNHELQAVECWRLIISSFIKVESFFFEMKVIADITLIMTKNSINA